MPDSREAMATLEAIAENPHAYAADWKQRHQRKAIGIMPMNFPPDIVHAAGGLPVVVQDTREPITEGASLLPEFYCGGERTVPLERLEVAESELGALGLQPPGDR